MQKAPTLNAPTLNPVVPIRFGLMALGCSALLGAALFTIDVDQGPVAIAAAVKRAEPVIVRHDSAGTLAQLHVTPGMDVAAGVLIAQFDRRHIENELLALRKRIDARRMDIDGLKQEAAALAGAGDKTTVRARIASLEAEALEADRVIVGHSARAALLEGQLDRLDIRAPVAGRIVEIAQVTTGMQLAAKAPLATIRPSPNRLQVDVSWPASAAAAPSAGQTARVWSAGALHFGGMLTATVESVGRETSAEATDARAGNHMRTGTDAGPDNGTSPNYPTARIALDVTGTALADQREGIVLNVQLVTGSKSLAEYLFAPLAIRRTSDKVTSERSPR